MASLVSIYCLKLMGDSQRVDLPQYIELLSAPPNVVPICPSLNVNRGSYKMSRGIHFCGEK